MSDSVRKKTNNEAEMQRQFHDMGLDGRLLMVLFCTIRKTTAFVPPIIQHISCVINVVRGNIYDKCAAF